jgi:hypothetical protein
VCSYRRQERDRVCCRRQERQGLLPSSSNPRPSSTPAPLPQATVNAQEAAACLAAAACKISADAGYPALTAALQAEVDAGALTCDYPPGLTTDVAGTPLEMGGARNTEAVAAAAVVSGEPEISVFRSKFAKHCPKPAAAAAAATTVASDAATVGPMAEVEEICDIIDALLQRVRRS